jgi:predicted nucleic acid-binding protein
VIVADTGAVLALMDRDDAHHEPLLALYDENPGAWVLPWAILPEIDYLLLTQIGLEAELDFQQDLAEGAWSIEWGTPADLARAAELGRQHADLALGLVDGIVAAVAERLQASAIATLDLRDFGALELIGSPRLLPRDL